MLKVHLSQVQISDLQSHFCKILIKMEFCDVCRSANLVGRRLAIALCNDMTCSLWKAIHARSKTDRNANASLGCFPAGLSAFTTHQLLYNNSYRQHRIRTQNPNPSSKHKQTPPCPRKANTSPSFPQMATRSSSSAPQPASVARSSACSTHLVRLNNTRTCSLVSR